MVQLNIKLILSGFIVGLGKIMPGVSGSMLAMTLGVYDKIIEAVTNFFSNPKYHIKLLLNFGVGLFIAIIIFSKLILFLLNNYYEPTIYLFLGLIIGTLLPFMECLKWNKKNIILFLIFLILSLFLTFKSSNINFVFTGNILEYLYVSILGLIDAFTSIVPGISGTAIFMLLGSYEFVLNTLSQPFSIPFIIYGIGLIIGIVLTCYLMAYLLKNKKDETHIVIFSFMISSIILLFLGIKNFLNPFMFLMLILGIILGYLLDK